MGLLTLTRMVICPLGLCLQIGLCTVALSVRKIGIKRAFATAVQDACGARASRPMVVHCLSRSMNTCVSSKKSDFVDGFYDFFSNRFGHDRGHASISSCVGPRRGSHGACVGSSLKTSRDHCLFANSSSCSSYRVASLRYDSKSVSKSSHLN